MSSRGIRIRSGRYRLIRKDPSEHPGLRGFGQATHIESSRDLLHRLQRQWPWKRLLQLESGQWADESGQSFGHRQHDVGWCLLGTWDPGLECDRIVTGCWIRDNGEIEGQSGRSRRTAGGWRW